MNLSAEQIEAARHRFESKLEPMPNGCIRFNGCDRGRGYRLIRVAGQNVSAHRFAWMLAGRVLPQHPLCLDHLCRDRGCVNVNHLEAVTVRENLLRGAGLTAQNAAKTHCPKGHPYSPDNLQKRNDNRRICRKCHSAASRAYVLSHRQPKETALSRG